MKRKIILPIFIVIIILAIIIMNIENIQAVTTDANSIEELSNKKIEWGIKREDNHEQPDLGSKNKSIIDEYSGIAIGNKESKNVYLTFDEGYEAGHTEQILEVLKENEVKAAFFITAHYLNTSESLVKQMIDEGHIVRKPYLRNIYVHVF